MFSGFWFLGCPRPRRPESQSRPEGRRTSFPEFSSRPGSGFRLYLFRTDAESCHRGVGFSRRPATMHASSRAATKGCRLHPSPTKIFVIFQDF